MTSACTYVPVMKNGNITYAENVKSVDRISYLTLKIVCDDHTHKQGESDHAANEDKDVDVYTMRLW